MPETWALPVAAAALMLVAAWISVPPPAGQRLGQVGPSRALDIAGRGRAPVVRARDRLRLGPAARRRRRADRVRVIQALGALAAELDAGQVPSVALQRCAGDPAVWPHAAAAAALDGRVPEALEADGLSHPVLRQLAACWRVAAESGSGLAVSIGRLAVNARVAEEVRVELEAQLAGPRATARTLSVLPIVGVGFGLMLGADPLAWLLGSTAGRLCLVLGVGLTLLGTWWTGRIARSVERLL